MAHPKPKWPRKSLSVVNLKLDVQNPRFESMDARSSQADLIKYLFATEKVMKIASSIAKSGWLPIEQLLGFETKGGVVIVEGNRRLAALKCLNNPALAPDSLRNALRKLIASSKLIRDLTSVPVVIAPSRQATEPILVARHVAGAGREWSTEAKAQFLTSKLSGGMSVKALQNRYDFSYSEIQTAVRRKAISDEIKQLSIDPAVVTKLTSHRSGTLTTIDRVLTSDPGRKKFMFEDHIENGFSIATTRKQFHRGLSKLATDVASGLVNSRVLNSSAQIASYLATFSPGDTPQKKRGSYTPSNVAPSAARLPKVATSRQSPSRQASSGKISPTLMKRNFALSTDDTKLLMIGAELRVLKVADHRFACAFLLRVFLEHLLSHYLTSNNEIEVLQKRWKDKTKGSPAKRYMTLRFMIDHVMKSLKVLISNDAQRRLVEKVLHKTDQSFLTINELNHFVHGSDIPKEDEIRITWERVKPFLEALLRESGNKASK